MRFIISVTFFFSFCFSLMGQGVFQNDSLVKIKEKFSHRNPGHEPKEFKLSDPIKWYSQTTSKGMTIQNSFPKGGPYTGSAGKNYNYSYLVFFTRVFNETDNPLELTVNFPADSFAIPYSPDTFVKLVLPPDTMRLSKQFLYSYGITTLDSLIDVNKPTMLQRTINPKEECLFYVVVITYQTMATTRNRDRGGNRAELVLNGQDLFYRMHPQIDSLPCGYIIFKK